MKRFKLVLAIVSLTLIILLLGIILFLRRVGTASLPQQDGKLAVRGLASNVQIDRDQLGVPYISAQSDSDAYIALGFVHAQDRFFQMEMYRRLGQGKLSEVFGEKTLAIDELFRTMRFREMSDSIYESASLLSRNILRWYSEGVNAYLSTAKSLPAEFSMLRFEPEPWSPEDCIVVARLMAWELNVSWWMKPVFGEIYNKLGPQKAALLIPLFGKSNSVGHPQDERGAASTLDRFIDVNSKALAFLDGVKSPGGAGSNNWTIAPAKTNTGSAILCNDPHLAFSIPAKWYYVSINSPSLHVLGVSLPGTPGVVIGRNVEISWGMTSLMTDDTDFYIVQPDSTNADYYRYDGKLFPFQSVADTIKVKDGQPYVFQKRMTLHGPVVSDIISKSYEMSSLHTESAPASGVIAVRWAACWPSDETKAIFLLNTAKNFSDFVNALRYFGTPAQNFVYADTIGNIGYKAAGNVPLRNYQMPYLPQSGTSSKFVWQSFIPFESLPESYDPSSRFIATANNITTPEDFPYYVSNLYEPSSRINRITSFISNHDTMTVGLCKQLQLDYQSDLMTLLDSRLLAACDSETYTPREIVYLKNFNGIISAKSTAATILNVTFVKLLERLFEPVLGSSLYERYVLISNVPTRIVDSMLTNSSYAARLYGLTNGDSLMNANLVESLQASLQLLTEKFGEAPIDWMWGKVHTLELKHSMSSNSLIRRLYDLGPYARGGNNTTVNNGEFSLDDPYNMLIGPSMRMIVDMSKPGMYFSLPGGECGQLLSQHYSDFLNDYLQGEMKFFPMNLSQGDISHTLELIPQ